MSSQVQCNQLLFKDFCEKLDKIEKTKKTDQKIRVIFNKELVKHLQGGSVFPLLRLLLPINDNTRQKYGLKQATLAKTYIDALQLNKSSNDAKRLKYWKNPLKFDGLPSDVQGDFCLVLEDILESRVSAQGASCTIGSVNSILDDLANAASEQDKTIIIRDRILNKFSAMEQKWLMRIVFQDLKIGLKYEQVLKFMSPGALQCYNECTDLFKVCEEAIKNPMTSSSLSSNEDKPSNVSSGLQVFSCLSPMLAKGFPNTGQINEVHNAMKDHPFYMDVKLDGERMLCHVRGNSGKMFTRNGNDYSNMYQSLCEDIVKSVNCDACIIDGEVCGWDDEIQRFIPFGHNKTVAKLEERKAGRGAGKSDDDNDHGEEDGGEGGEGGGGNGKNGLSQCLIFVVFDVLYVEGLRVKGCPISNWNYYVNLPVSFYEEQWHTNGVFAPSVQNDFMHAFSNGIQGSLHGEITHLPLCTRRAILKDLIQLTPRRIQAVKCCTVLSTTKSERLRAIESYFNQVSEAGEEGCVVKDALSPYVIGVHSRQSMYWIKMKPEYSDMTKDLDLIVLGAYFGEGKSMRGRGVSTFLCGVKEDSLDQFQWSGMGSAASGDFIDSCLVTSQSSVGGSQGSASSYRTLCKVGTGYSFAQLEELRGRFRDVMVPWDSNKQNLPKHFSAWKIGKTADVPDFWIPPEKSVVVELKCAEIVISNQFSAGYTCRFPRLRKIRYDKNTNEVMSLSDVMNIIRNPRMKKVVDDTTKGVGNGRGRKKAHVGVDGEDVSSLLEGIRSNMNGSSAQQFLIPRNKIDVLDTLLEGYVFCVLDNDYTSLEYSRSKIIELIQSHSGGVVANAIIGCLVVSGVSKTLQFRSIVSSGNYDVVTLRYILDIVSSGNRSGCEDPMYYLAMTKETKQIFEEEYDEFGDSYRKSIHPNRALEVISYMDVLFNGWNSQIGDKGNGGTIVKKATGARSNKRKLVETPTSSASYSQSLHSTLRKKSWRSLAQEVLDDEDCSVLFDDNPYTLFWRNNFIAYLDQYDVDSAESAVWSNPRLVATELKLRLHGAEISKTLSADVTHVVVDSSRLERGPAIKKRLRELRFDKNYRHEKRVVDISWVEDCLMQKKILETDVTKHSVTL